MKDKMKNNKSFCTVFIYIIIILAFTFFTLNALSSGTESLKSNYLEQYDNEFQSSSNSFYKLFYDYAESRYHVKNTVSISVSQIKEINKLEVLNVYDEEFITQTNVDSNAETVAWLKIPGEGTFVIDLSTSEFIIDDERAHVLVRIPKPKLTNVSIIYEDVELIYYSDKHWGSINGIISDSISAFANYGTEKINELFGTNYVSDMGIFEDGSYAEGFDIFHDQLNQGEQALIKEFTSNQYFYLSAEKAAITSLECLVKQMNPGIDNLEVDIEFM